MNDLILSNLVKNFADRRGLSNLDTASIFEAFVTSSVLRRYHQSDIVDVEDTVLVGGGGDGGIDAIAILVNGRPVCTEDDVEFLAEKLRRLDVEFVFVQAKTGTGFSAKEIGNFVFGVREFFSAVLEQPTTSPFRAEILQLIDLARYIYGKTVMMQDNPRCFLYFATTGKWECMPEPERRFAEGANQLETMNLFSCVTRSPVDAELLKKTYQELERSVVKEVEFGKSAVFPRIEGVDEAYIGLLPGNQLIELVSTTEGSLNRELFYDNVRDFQGDNPVNQEIDHTLGDEQDRNSFPLLNNGITIVARSIRRIGDTFKISDFQIVNGCQTTHVLFRNRDAVDAGVFVPVKLVATSDSSVIAEVIKATNRQTPVLPEALESLSRFHKDLEAFYNAREEGRSPSHRVYYERRSKQYLTEPISPSNIVSLTAQIKSFVAMFLNEPHSHPRYYGELLKSYKDKLFVDDHKPGPYYASGVALLEIEKLLASGEIDRALRRYKHHLLMVLRVRIGGYSFPQLSSDRITEYSLGIVDALRADESGRREHIQDAVERLTNAITRFSASSRQPHLLKAFTEELLRGLGATREGKRAGVSDRQPTAGERERGEILWYNNAKFFGFIEREVGGRMFVHEREIGAVPWHLRKERTRVTYTVIEDRKRPGGFMAGSVQLRSA